MAAKDEGFVKRVDFSSGNLASSWKTFKSQFNILRIAKKMTEDSEEEQICKMLVQMGPESVNIYEQFTYSEDDDNTKKTLANTIRFFDNHFEPVKNVIFERAKFNSMKQNDLSIHQFIVNLQSQAVHCDHGEVKNDLIRDRIVVGVKNQKLREYLIDLEDLDLNKCIQKSKQYTSNHGQTFFVQESSNDNTDELENLNLKRQERGQNQRTYRPGEQERAPIRREFRPSEENPCKFCNKSFHRGRFCPAKDTKCNVCNEKGHWARSKACKGRKDYRSRQMNEVQASNGEQDDLDGLFLGSDLQ